MNFPKNESLWFKIARHNDVSNVMQTSKIGWSMNLVRSIVWGILGYVPWQTW